MLPKSKVDLYAAIRRDARTGNIIETGTDSYRLATTRARAEQQPAI
ncbi:hypothetical protein ACIQVT_11865 [Streptomyces sp. NPDC100445]